MKRILVVLLAALLLLSFTSCNQDKIEELEAQVAQEKANNEATIKNFEDFASAYSVIASYSYIYRYAVLGTPSDSVDFTLDTTTAAKVINYRENYIPTLEEGESIDAADVSLEAASGTITGKNVYGSSYDSNVLDDIDLTFTNNSFTVKYTVRDKDDKAIADKTDLTVTVTVSGKYIQKEDATTGVTTMSFDGKINGTEYNFSMNQKEDGSFTSAKINGKDVELRLLNAMNGTGK